MTVLDDPSLIARARSGDAEAYGQLYERHVGVALGVARRVTDRDAEDVVSDAFARTFAVLREGGGPDVAFRPYVLRAVRNAAVDRHRREGRVDPVAAVDEAQTPLHREREVGDPVVDALERQLAVRAFDSLPERWRTVLWHTEVQGEAPAQVAPLLGISPRAVAQLAVRAREGLRTAWLREHAQHVPAGHETVVAMLAPSVRSSLGARDGRALDEHLAACPGCRRVQDELVEVNATLRAAVLPAVLGLTAAQMGWTGPTAGGAMAGAAASGGAATSGGTGGHGIAAAVSGALSHPVAAGVVAVAVAASGVGGYALWDSLREPRTAQVDARPARSTPTPPPSGGVDAGTTRPTDTPSASAPPAPSAPPESGTGTGQPSSSSPATSTPPSPASTSSGSSSGSSSSEPSCEQDGGPPRTPDAASAASSGTAPGTAAQGASPEPSSSCASSSEGPSSSASTSTTTSSTFPSSTSTSGGTSSSRPTSTR